MTQGPGKGILGKNVGKGQDCGILGLTLKFSCPHQFIPKGGPVQLNPQMFVGVEELFKWEVLWVRTQG